jgi:hypothetical protein
MKTTAILGLFSIAAAMGAGCSGGGEAAGGATGGGDDASSTGAATGGGGSGEGGGGPGGGGPACSGDPIAAPDEQWSWVPFADAQCGYGTTAGIGINRTSKSDKLLLYLMGGGGCFTQQECAPGCNPQFQRCAANLDGYDQNKLALRPRLAYRSRRSFKSSSPMTPPGRAFGRSAGRVDEIVSRQPVGSGARMSAKPGSLVSKEGDQP